MTHLQAYKVKRLMTNKDLDLMEHNQVIPYSYEGEKWVFKRTRDGFVVYEEDRDLPHTYKDARAVMVDFIDLGFYWDHD